MPSRAGGTALQYPEVVKTPQGRTSKARAPQLASAKVRHEKDAPSLLMMQHHQVSHSTNINIDLTGNPSATIHRSVMEKSVSDKDGQTPKVLNKTMHAKINIAEPQSPYQRTLRQPDVDVLDTSESDAIRQGTDGRRYEIADEAEPSAPNQMEEFIDESASYRPRDVGRPSPVSSAVHRAGPRSTMGTYMNNKPVTNYIPLKFAKKSVLGGSATGNHAASDTVSNPFQRCGGLGEELVYVESCQDT